MDSRRSSSVESVDRLLKCVLVLARTVEEVLEVRAVHAANGRPMGTSIVQVLRLLNQRGGHTASQVARFLGVSKPRISQMIDIMERGELVVRRRTKHDQREVLLELTKRGRQSARAIQQEQRHWIRLALRQMRRPDAAKWADAFHEFAGAMARADRVCEEFCLQCGAHADTTCVLTGGEAECPYLKHAPSSPRKLARDSRKGRSRKTRS